MAAMTLDASRKMAWSGMLDRLAQDLRFAGRSLRRNPAVTALIIVTFPLGIGVNAATFGLLDRIYLRPPVGVVRPGEVHRIWIQQRFEGGQRLYTPTMSYPMYRVIRALWEGG